MKKTKEYESTITGLTLHNLTGLGQVYDVYDLAANIIVDNQLVALIRAQAPMAAFSLKVDLEIPFKEILEVNEPCNLTPSHFEFANLTIKRSQIIWHNDRLKRQPILESSFDLVEQQLKKRGYPGLSLIFEPTPDFGDGVEGQILRNCQRWALGLKRK